MPIPEKIPGRRWLASAWGIYGVVWIALEGRLWRVVFLAVLTTAVILLTLTQKYLAGRVLTLRWWLVGMAGAGGCGGTGSGLLTLLLMAVKTGLHAHGPEFSAADILWVTQQIPLWTAVGLTAGLGTGLLTWGIGHKRSL